MIRVPTDRPPTHPGEILLEEFLKPLDMSQSELARRIDVSWPRVNELVRGGRAVTMDTAMRLGRLFDTGPELWMNLQLRWDLYHAQRASGAALARIQPLRSVA
jgi:addiction module HigA family antidote